MYGYKNFKTTLYPTPNFVYNNFEKEIKKEEYFQIQFDYNFKVSKPDDIYMEYKNMERIFIDNKTKIVNQLVKIKAVR